VNSNTFILLSRSILDSEVFASQILLKIWVWCLCKASYKDRYIPIKFGRGEKTLLIKRGQFLFGRHKAEEELFIDGSTIYKSIKRLELLGNISIKSNNQYSIITICNYNTYQDPDNYKVATKEQPSNNQVTTKEQPSNTNKKVNKVKNVNKVAIAKKFTIPTKAQFAEYAVNNNIPKTVAAECWYYYDKIGWTVGKDQKKMKNWESALSGWWVREKKKNSPIDETPKQNYDRVNYGDDNMKSFNDIIKNINK